MNLHHLFLLIFIVSVFYFVVGSFFAHFLDKIFFEISANWKTPKDSKNTKLFKIIILAIFQTFFIILSFSLIRTFFKYYYNFFFKNIFGNYNLPEADGIILLGSLYVIFSTHYKHNLEELLHIMYNE